MRQIVKLTESDIHGIIYQVIKESFNHWKSPKLAKIIKKHGMGEDKEIGDNYFLTQLTDENIEGVSPEPFVDEEYGIFYTPLGDGMYLLYNVENNEIAKDYLRKSIEEFNDDARELLKK